MIKITNITRQDLYALVHAELGLPKVYCTNFVDDIFGVITTGISKEKKVKISLFGTFTNRSKKSRIGRNPKTKEQKIISNRDVVLFNASKEFKDLVNSKNDS